MTGSWDALINTMWYAVRYSSPLLLAALGEAVAEKSGVLNLGVEGIMAVGAAVGYVAAYSAGSPWIGVAAALAAGLLLGLLHSFMTVTLRASQVVSGLAIAIGGVGLSSMLVRAAVGPVTMRVETLPSLDLGLPGWLRWLSGHDPLTYAALVLAPLLYLFLEYTHPGLVVRAVGEDPSTAESLGVSVSLARYAAVSFGGAMAGLAGSVITLVITGSWFDGITAGRGWLALGIVILGVWNPLAIVAASLLVGFMMALPDTGPKLGIAANEYLLRSLPYITVVAVLTLVSVGMLRRRAGAPSSLGKSEW